MGFVATGQGSDSTFELSCRVTVDGLRVSERTGHSSCTSYFDLGDLAKAKAHATP